MECVSNWRINVFNTRTRDGIEVPAGAMLVVGDGPNQIVRQCDQIVFDPATQSHLIVANNRLYRLGDPMPIWKQTLHRAGRSIRGHLNRLSTVLDDIQRLNTAHVH